MPVRDKRSRGCVSFAGFFAHSKKKSSGTIFRASPEGVRRRDASNKSARARHLDRSEPQTLNRGRNKPPKASKYLAFIHHKRRFAHETGHSGQRVFRCNRRKCKKHPSLICVRNRYRLPKNGVIPKLCGKPTNSNDARSQLKLQRMDDLNAESLARRRCCGLVSTHHSLRVVRSDREPPVRPAGSTSKRRGIATARRVYALTL